MKRYQCHSQVQADKIAWTDLNEGTRKLKVRGVSSDDLYEFDVAYDDTGKRASIPQTGDYVILYDDGTQSWCRCKPFEDDFKKLKDEEEDQPAGQPEKSGPMGSKKELGDLAVFRHGQNTVKAGAIVEAVIDASRLEAVVNLESGDVVPLPIDPRGRRPQAGDYVVLDEDGKISWVIASDFKKNYKAV